MKCGSSTDVIHKEVVIIGNGPSGISLSYMLSGNVPYVKSNDHPDDMLSARLKPIVGQSLVKQDLEQLSTGLDGRTRNPVSLLLDSLLYPCADAGLELEPLVEFRTGGKEIEHIVLGKGPPGGTWHKIDPHILTLSLASWMSLPGLPFQCRDSGEKRAYACNVAEYYSRYVKEMKLEDNFNNGTLVTAVRPIKRTKRSNSVDMREDSCWVKKIDSQRVKLCVEPECDRKNRKCILSNAFNYIWARGNKQIQSRCCKRPRNVNGGEDAQILSCDSNTDCDKSLRYLDDYSFKNSYALRNSSSLEFGSDKTVPYCFNSNFNSVCDFNKNVKWLVEAVDTESGKKTIYTCNYLVLANGSSDLPNKLAITKDETDPDWVIHDLRALESRIDRDLKERKVEDMDPVLVVGAGLSAADAVIAVRGKNVPVVHVFRNKSATLNKQLPENMYPEYHKVHQMMQDGGSTYPLYKAYPEFTPTSANSDTKEVILTSKGGETVKLKISYVAVFIGSRPDLTFLPQTNIGVKKDIPVDNKTNTVDIDRFTHRVNGYDNLFAIGPLAGDNFVRFLPGGALAVVKEIYDQNGYEA